MFSGILKYIKEPKRIVLYELSIQYVSCLFLAVRNPKPSSSIDKTRNVENTLKHFPVRKPKNANPLLHQACLVSPRNVEPGVFTVSALRGPRKSLNLKPQPYTPNPKKKAQTTISPEAPDPKALPRGSIVVPFWDYIPYRILHMNPKKELLWSLRVCHTFTPGFPCHMSGDGGNIK